MFCFFMEFVVVIFGDLNFRFILGEGWCFKKMCIEINLVKGWVDDSLDMLIEIYEEI